jgi:hypothetical protein
MHISRRKVDEQTQDDEAGWLTARNWLTVILSELKKIVSM